MFEFGERSLEVLNELDPRLQEIMIELIQIIDVSLIEGHRDAKTQNLLFNSGRSKLEWPNSKHNSMPSRAVDVVPYPIDWANRERFVFMCGIIKGIAHNLQIPIRMGIDWDGDNDLYDQTFNDLPHIELL